MAIVWCVISPHGADSNIQSAVAFSAQAGAGAPNHMVSSSGPLTLIKLAWHSLAIALASSVLPQPARAHARGELQRLLVCRSHRLDHAKLCTFRARYATDFLLLPHRCT